ncbi:PEP/pyruvate-binding domain-containing protein [Escherichia coli]
MPDASFAGQQETFLNVRGIDAVMIAVKHVFALLSQRPSHLLSGAPGL